MVDPISRYSSLLRTGKLYSQAVHAPDRPTDNYRGAACISSPSYETHRVASEVTLAHAQESGKGHSVAPLSPSTPSLVVKQEQCTLRQIIASHSTWSSKVYSRLKLRLGCILRGLHCNRCLVTYRKSPLHQLKTVFLTLKSFKHPCRDQVVLIAMDNTTVVAYINKEGSRRSDSLCTLLLSLLSWCQPRGIVPRSRHIAGLLAVIVDMLSGRSQMTRQSGPYLSRFFNI